MTTGRLDVGAYQPGNDGAVRLVARYGACVRPKQRREKPRNRPGRAGAEVGSHPLPVPAATIKVRLERLDTGDLAYRLARRLALLLGLYQPDNGGASPGGFRGFLGIAQLRGMVTITAPAVVDFGQRYQGAHRKLRPNVTRR